MNYEIVETGSNNSRGSGIKFHVREKQTEQNIMWFRKKSEAVAFLRHLNLGGSFDGWTPAFFLKKISINLKND